MYLRVERVGDDQGVARLGEVEVAPDDHVGHSAGELGSNQKGECRVCALHTGETHPPLCREMPILSKSN